MNKSLLLFIILVFVSKFSFSQNGIDKPIYQIETHRAGSYLGTFDIELFPLIAPLHVQNFDSLVNDQFFDSTAFHRVVPGFVIQGGDPNTINGPMSTWGQGQPWQVTVPAEFSVVRHLRGILGAARDVDPNSANSQFYICVANATFLDGNYTVYGKVINGMNVVDTIVNEPRDANDIPLQKIEMFVTYTGVNDSIPDAPLLTSPADGVSGILNTQTFIWSAVNTAVMYTIEFSTDPGFSVIDISVNAGNNSSMVSAIQGNTTYYWRVKSNNGGHESAYSAVRSFTTATGSAQLIYPPDASNSIAVNPVFEWDPVPGADNYTLQVSVSATFTTQNMVYNTSGITSTTQQVTGLNPNTLYYWRVRSANGTTQGYYSSKFTFTTGTSTGINESVAGIRVLNVMPNPASDILNISAQLSNAGTVGISVYDLPGKQIYHEQLTTVAGKLDYRIPLTGISKGMYLLALEFEGSVVTRRIVVE